MDLGLSGRVAIVTGGSRGIGQATAEALAVAGVRVAVTYCHRRIAADAVADAICARGGEALAVALDLENAASIAAAVAAVAARWQRVDVLVNNAVRWADHRASAAPAFERLGVDEWAPLLRANIEGVFGLTQRVVPLMRRHGWGRIVNVSAVAARDGMPGLAWYTTAKAAIHGLTRTLARELGGDGILVNAVMPGLTLTERTFELVPPQAQQDAAERTPGGRLLTPAQIAATVVFLCSAANMAITGEVIRASGGYVTPHRQPRRAAAAADLVTVAPSAGTV